MAVPYVFANATSAIPLSNLDNNFSTPVTIGNVAIQLGNTATTLGNVTMANVTITSVSTPITVTQGGTGNSSAFTANAVVYAPTTSTTATSSNLVWTGTNLGIGTSSPSYLLDVKSAGTSNITNGIRFSRSTTATQYGVLNYENGQFNNVAVNTAGSGCYWGVLYSSDGSTTTQPMSLDTSGNLLVGTTSTSVTSGGIYNRATNSNGSSIIIGHQSGVGSGNSFAEFQYAGGLIGYISQVGTTGVAYNSISDYRLKNNPQRMVGALTKVMQLNPCTYTWKSDGSDGQGFIAHELAEVCPDAVVGEKDAVDEDGNPKYQGVDTSFLVATLTSAIQELSTLITAQSATIQSLTDRITALEGART